MMLIDVKVHSILKWYIISEYYYLKLDDVDWRESTQHTKMIHYIRILLSQTTT